MSDLTTTVGTEEELAAERGSPFSTSVQRFFAPGKMEELSAYLVAEIQAVFDGQDRKDALEKWKTIRRHRKAKPENPTKDFPWPNASNVVTPITMSNSLGMFSKLKGLFSKKVPLVAMETTDESLKEAVDAASEFMNAYATSPLHLNFPKKASPLFYETTSMGLQVVDVSWTRREYVGKRFATGGGAPEAYNVVSFDGPDIDSVPLEDFLTRPYWDEPKTAPWVAFQKRWMGYEVVQLAKQGFFEGVLTEQGGVVQASQTTQLREYEQVNLEQSGFTSQLQVSSGSHYDIQKVYVRWDVDGDDISEDVIVWFHKDTGTILRAEYNSLGIRPVVSMSYVAMPHELYALGVGEMSMGSQEEIDTFHNMANNSLALSSLQMLVTRTGAVIGGTDDWYPGKNIEVDDPTSDVTQLTFPDVSGPLTVREGLSREYLNRAIGASDPSLGYSDSILRTRATASGAMFQANTQDELFQDIMVGVMEATSEIFQLIWLQMVANPEKAKPLVEDLVSDPDKQQLILDLLEMDIADIPRKLKFSIRVTPSSQTEDAKRANMLAVNQLYIQFEDRILQLMSAMNNPQTPPDLKAVIGKFILGHTELVRETLKGSGFMDTEDFLPYTKPVEELVKTLEAQMGAGGNGSGQGTGQENLGGGLGANGGGVGFGAPADAGFGPGVPGGPSQGTGVEGGQPPF